MKKIKIIHKRIDRTADTLIAAAEKEGFFVGAEVRDEYGIIGPIDELLVIRPDDELDVNWATNANFVEQRNGKAFVAARYVGCSCPVFQLELL